MQMFIDLRNIYIYIHIYVYITCIHMRIDTQITESILLCNRMTHDLRKKKVVLEEEVLRADLMIKRNEKSNEKSMMCDLICVKAYLRILSSVN
jgi:hypothetical protein